jgi:hypothetical protein
MGQAGDECSQRDHELQKRTALHGERECAVRDLVCAGDMCPEVGECVLVNRAHTHVGLWTVPGDRFSLCADLL